MSVANPHRVSICVLIFLLILCLAALSASGVFTRTSAASVDSNSAGAPDHSPPPPPPTVDKVTTLDGYGKLPLNFEVNEGQSDSTVKFLARGHGYKVFLTAGGAVISLQSSANKAGQAGPSTALRFEWVGASADARVAGLDPLPGKVNYFRGSKPADWRTGIATFSRVRYERVYPGIDLVYYGNQRQLEYDFNIQPGADLKQIRLSIAGAEKLKINRQGELEIATANGKVKLQKPVAYQLIAGRRKGVVSRYRLAPNGDVSFRVGKHDPLLPLVIDPVLTYSTYLGGSLSDEGLAIAVDNAGSAYITGETTSLDFPRIGGTQPNLNGSADAFVTKLNATGSQIIYSTFLGGDGVDTGRGIAVDAAGNAHVVGQTAGNFPLMNPLHSTYGGFFDAFVAKLNNSGSALIYSTYLGGSSFESGNAIALGPDGEVFVTGQTNSRDFPTTNPLQAAKSGTAIFKSVNAAASWHPSDSGLLGETVNDIVFVPGTPATVFAGCDNGIYKSTDGGANWVRIALSQFSVPVTRIAVDPTNPLIVYVATGLGPYRSTDGGNTFTLINNGFFPPVARTIVVAPTTPTTLYATSFNSIVWRSIDSGANWTGEFINAVNSVNLIVVDPTNSATLYAGTNRGVFQSTNGGSTWVGVNAGINLINIRSLRFGPGNPSTLYAAGNGGVFKSTNSGVSWTSLNGNLVNPSVGQLLLDPSNFSTMYIRMTVGASIFKTVDGGTTWLASPLAAVFPITALALDPSNPNTLFAGSSSGAEGFVTRLSPGGTSQAYSTYLGGVAADVGNAIAVDSDGNAYLTGSTSSTDFPLASAIQPTRAGLNDAFVTKINAAGSLAFSTFLGGDSDDAGRGIAVDSGRNVYVTGFTGSANFPVANAFQPAPAPWDAFVTKLNPAGTSYVYSTYLGGAGLDQAYAIAVSAAGEAVVTGITESVSFPLVSPIQPNLGSLGDAFVTKFNAAGNALTFSTYLGGNDSEFGFGIALDAAGNSYVVGTTQSTTFPTVNPIQSASAGETEAFVSRISATVAISGRVTQAGNPGSGVSGVTVQVNAATTTTDANGDYRFSDLASGADYTVAVTSPGHSYVPARVILNDVITSQTVHFVQYPLAAGRTISGQVTDAQGNPINNVLIKLNGGTDAVTNTGVDGRYTFNDVPVGPNYAVTPFKVGAVFNPSHINIDGFRFDSSNNNFVSTNAPTNAAFRFDAPSIVASEAAGTVTVNVIRSGSTAAASVSYQGSNGTAHAADYNPVSGTLQFANGETSKSFTITLHDDLFRENPETVYLTLSNPQNGFLDEQSLIVLTIADNDPTSLILNPLDEARFFVRQHYLDFLNREPDQGGWDYWTAQITDCGSNALCVHSRRIGVSGAFFVELEFQRTGYVVYRMHRAAFGTEANAPTLAKLTFEQFMADRPLIVDGPGLPQSTIDFANAFVQRQSFLTEYPLSQTNAQFVNKVFDTAGLTPYVTERQQQIDAMTNNGKTRAQVLLDVIEIAEFKEREYNRSFVLMQYFGYLRRGVDLGGYNFWLNVLNNQEPNNYRGMICSFLTSAEYQQRFGTAVTRTNADCSQ